jgi:signal peptidase complex subunit 1
MANQLLEKVRNVAEGQIDFEGQRFTEFLSTAMLAIVGVSIPDRSRFTEN